MQPVHQPAPQSDDEQAYAAAHESAPDIPVGTAIPHGDALHVQEEVYADPLDFDDDHLARLGLTLDFGPADLDANQSGVLSDLQLERLENDLRTTYWPVIGALAAVVLILGVTGALSGSLVVFPMLFMMALALIPAVLLYLEREKLPQQPVKRTTLRVGGFSLMARRFGALDEANATGKIKLPVQGGKQIFAPQHVYKVLKSGQTYIVYYVPVRTWVGYRALSIEPVEDIQKSSARKPKRKTKGKRG
ncbi:MAG: hypothetical protein K8S97_01170 [Anaerolineae bacterium]|nr:hypothetical protein [Anaerolineae bacterium]